MAKRRLAALLLERGLVESYEKAQVAVMAGDVLVDDRPAVGPGSLVDEAASLRLVERQRYVGRGGEKLEHALDAFAVDVAGAVAADIGASTGGFTDCLLDVMYEIPSRGDVKKCVVDADSIRGLRRPLLLARSGQAVELWGDEPKGETA